MADPIRLQVLKALTDHLQAVTMANGYTYDLDGKVFRGRARFDENDPDTMLAILESPRPDGSPYFAGENQSVRSEKWQLLLQGWCPEDPQNPSDNAYILAADVERCLGRIVAVRKGHGGPEFPAEYLLGGLITSFTAGSPVVRPPTEGVSSKTFFYMPLLIGLATSAG